jgi:sigma-B regulation protein RsbU (phosphoserine phosphatase)
MLSLDETCQYLRKSKFFAHASEDTVKSLADLAELLRIKAGDKLFDKGEIGTAMYFVVDGCVRIHNDDVVITHLGKGQVFGEVAALSHEVRTASVTAEIDTALIKLEQTAIYDTLSTQPDAARSLIQALCRRESEIIEEKFERLVKAKVMENELDIGQKIQRNFLPELIPEIEGWNMKGILQPARKVAGDFFDFFIVPKPHCIGIVIGDVCDKGLGAALFMTLFRSLIRSISIYRNVVGEKADPDDVVNTLRHAIALTNKYIASTHASSNMFSSVFFGLLIPETGQLCYINAGHESPLIIDASGVRQQLGPTGPVIGIFEDAEHEIGMTEIFPGEILFGYTDGATDALNEAGEQFTEERLVALAGEGAKNGGAMLHKLLSAVEGFIGNAEQYDDITMITVYREMHAAD